MASPAIERGADMKALPELDRADVISPGISACVGCNVELTLRTVMRVLGRNSILAIPPGCMGGVGVVGWGKKSGAEIPVFFPLLTNTASMLTGIKLAHEKAGRDVQVVAFAGDGATVDAGFQALSGAAERNDRIIYICYDNEGYMNTGYQRSSATPRGAWTSTTPHGKLQIKKDIPRIMADHRIPYVATCSPAYIEDMIDKVKKAQSHTEGFSYLHVLNPCVSGWGFAPEDSIAVCRASVQSRYFPLYEVENGRYRITVDVPRPRPVADYIRMLKKFARVTQTDLNGMQAEINRRWRELKALEEATGGMADA